MNKRERSDEEPSWVTLEMARAFCEWKTEKDKRELSLPTLDQLLAAIERKEIVISGPEWTAEGFIYYPMSGETDREPTPEATAGFRLVRNIPPGV